MGELNISLIATHVSMLDPDLWIFSLIEKIFHRFLSHWWSCYIKSRKICNSYDKIKEKCQRELVNEHFLRESTLFPEEITLIDYHYAIEQIYENLRFTKIINLFYSFPNFIDKTSTRYVSFFHHNSLVNLYGDKYFSMKIFWHTRAIKWKRHLSLLHRRHSLRKIAINMI